MALLFVVIEDPSLVSEFRMDPEEKDEIQEIEDFEVMEFKELDAWMISFLCLVILLCLNLFICLGTMFDEKDFYFRSFCFC